MYSYVNQYIFSFFIDVDTFSRVIIIPLKKPGNIVAIKVVTDFLHLSVVIERTPLRKMLPELKLKIIFSWINKSENYVM